MTDEQFKQLMEKLDRIEKEIQAGQWRHLFQPQPIPQPAYPLNPAPWPTWPIITD